MAARTALALAVAAVALAPLDGRPQAPEPPPIPAGRAPEPGEYVNGMDVLHYDLELALGPENRFDGRARILVRLGDPAPEALIFDLTGLAVYDVSVAGRPVAHGLEDGRLRVSLANTFLEGEEIETVVSYGGVPDDGLILRNNVHGRPAAFADNWPDRARFWFPAVDHPGDKATVAFEVHAPADWVVVANGRMETPPEPTADAAPGDRAQRRIWRWRTDVDIPTYTMVVGAAAMEVRTLGLAACGRAPASRRRDGCIEVSLWAFPPDVDEAAPSFARATDMVDFFTRTLGPFPYEKLAHVQSATRFGGMENASAIFYAEDALAEGRDIESTVSHETAHQWFGDSVTEGRWHHLWLSEGFATYFGNLYFEHADGSEAMRARMEADRLEYVLSGHGHRPVIDEAERDLFALLNRNNYQKGGWILHMLRHLVGDEAFFRGVRAYYAERAHGTALTEDFQRHVESAADRDLGWFFEQWLRRPGHPILSVQAAQEGEEVTVTVEQRQPDAWPTFRFPLTLALTSGGDTRRVTLQVDSRHGVFRLPGPAPDALAVDPDGVLLMELDLR